MKPSAKKKRTNLKRLATRRRSMPNTWRDNEKNSLISRLRSQSYSRSRRKRLKPNDVKISKTKRKRERSKSSRRSR